MVLKFNIRKAVPISGSFAKFFAGISKSAQDFSLQTRMGLFSVGARALLMRDVRFGAPIYLALEAFEQDLHQHIHLEKPQLFPRAVELQVSR